MVRGISTLVLAAISLMAILIAHWGSQFVSFGAILPQAFWGVAFTGILVSVIVGKGSEMP